MNSRETRAHSQYQLPNPGQFRSPIQTDAFSTGDRPLYTSPSGFNQAHFGPPVFQTPGPPRDGLPTPFYPPQGHVPSMPPRAPQNVSTEPPVTDFPFPDLECYGELICGDRTVSVDALAVMNNGIKYEEGEWTCYRRNYLSLHTHYTLSPNIPNAPLYLRKPDGTVHLVQAIAMRVSSCVDGEGGKTIPLVQFTPKRDSGPKTQVKMWTMMPYTAPPVPQLTPMGMAAPVPMTALGYQRPQRPIIHPNTPVIGPSLQYQDYVEPQTADEISSSWPQYVNPGREMEHLFERIQFKIATQNNGERRASQQYFHLFIELHVDTRKAGDTEPQWNLVAKRTSGKIVVRGRSPSHYRNKIALGTGAGGNGRGSGGRRGGRNGPSGSFTYGAHTGFQSSSPDTGAGAPMGYPNTGAGAPTGYANAGAGSPMGDPSTYGGGFGFPTQGLHGMYGMGMHGTPKIPQAQYNTQGTQIPQGRYEMRGTPQIQQGIYGMHGFSQTPHGIYTMQRTPAHSVSGSDTFTPSMGDASGGSGRGVKRVSSDTFDEDHEDPAATSGLPRKRIRSHNGYTYYGGAMYEGHPRREGEGYVSTEPQHHALHFDSPQGTVGARYAGDENSGPFRPYPNSSGLFPENGGSNS